MNKHLFLTALLLSVCATLFATGDHLVTVVIQDDGSARVTHRLTKTIYESDGQVGLGIDYPDGVEVSDISVSSGSTQYTVLDSWEGGGSRSCALARTDIGYKIIWSTLAYAMNSRQRENYSPQDEAYQVEYTLKGLVRHYDDFDGLTFMFVNKELGVFNTTLLTLSFANGKELNEENSGISCTGFEGEWGWNDAHQLVAYTTKKYQIDMMMVVSAQFSHGLLQPSQTAEGTFLESVNTRLTADFLEDKQPEQPTTFGDYIIYGFFIILAIVIVLGVLAGLPYLLWSLFSWLYDRLTFGPSRRRNQQKQFVEKEADYWREPPFKGSIFVSNYELNSTQTIRPVPSAAEAINAYILRLIYRGSFGINDRGQLTVGEWSSDAHSTPSDAKHEKAIYELMLNASGPDRILQQGEVSTFLKDRPQYLWPLLRLGKGLATTFDDYNRKPFMPDQKLAGFRRFLKDFSLIGERRAVEVKLWREYMVFATLFGIADQVKKDMQTVCPEYLKLDELTSQMLSFHIDTSPYATVISERAAVAEQTAPDRAQLNQEARQGYEKERQKK